MSSEQHIAELRDEIRQAGRQTASARGRWWLSTAGSVFALLFVPATVSILSPGGHANSIGLAGVAIFAGALASGCACAIAPSLAAIQRAQFRRRLQDRLRSLAGSDQLRLLQPLQTDDDDDTRKIAIALARRVPGTAEISPAIPRGARDDEASPADE